MEKSTKLQDNLGGDTRIHGAIFSRDVYFCCEIANDNKFKQKCDCIYEISR